MRFIKAIYPVLLTVCSTTIYLTPQMIETNPDADLFIYGMATAGIIASLLVSYANQD